MDTPKDAAHFTTWRSLLSEKKMTMKFFNRSRLTMSDCCSPLVHAEKHPQKYCCPRNGMAYAEVPVRTITHHIKESWHWTPSAEHYYFCSDPDCDVVYFAEDGSTVLRDSLRSPVGVKALDEQSLLCYCFGISRADFQFNPATRDFVVAQTQSGQCSCETSNPSGRCCLKDFPKPLK
jgi:hypothetical protein